MHLQHFARALVTAFSKPITCRKRVPAGRGSCQSNQAAAAYAPRELDDHSFGPEASMSAALDLLGAAAQNRSLEADAVEIRLRATRKLDEL
jgi:hypothetical protein